MSDKITKYKKIAILTTCEDDWGGCEELWYRSLPYLKEAGADLLIYKKNFNRSNFFINTLAKDNVILRDLRSSHNLHERVVRKLSFLIKKINDPYYHIDYPVQNFHNKLIKDKPSLVVISQAINFDGLKYAYQCLRLKIPYIIVSHKAVDFYWPSAQDKDYMRETMESALLCCFVSHHNLQLTEDQFGMKLTNSKVIFNPIKLKRQILKYPSTANGIRLACLGRFFLIDKGQDILISVLAQQKWRDRPITVALMGGGPDLINIREMIKLHQLTNISIYPYNNNLEDIWLNYHALILPSRSEGLPLTIVEAMTAGRPIITTNAGGNAEMVQEGISGFVGEANRRSLDETMERAWQNQTNWEAMGIKGSEFVKKNIPESPEKKFANLLINVL